MRPEDIDREEILRRLDGGESIASVGKAVKLALPLVRDVNEGTDVRWPTIIELAEARWEPQRIAKHVGAPLGRVKAAIRAFGKGYRYRTERKVVPFDIIQRRLDGETLTDLGKAMGGVTRERARQILARVGAELLASLGTHVRL